MSVDSIWLERGWIGVALWAALFIGDYALTLWGARLYRGAPSAVIRFEGSYELTPAYRKDIDAGRTVSPRFLVALIASTAALVLAWWWLRTGWITPLWFAFVVGALALRELPVYKRHIQNIVFFRNFSLLRVAAGSRIEYPRGLVYRLSSVDMGVAAAFLLLLAALVESAFLLGGSVGCLAMAVQHAAWARRAPAPPA
jgi:hypothetical protein